MSLKRKILLLIPIAIIAGFLIYTWGQIIFISHWANWRHYVGLILFAIVLYFVFTNFKKAVLATGIYLIIGTLNLLTITQDVITAFFSTFGSLEIHTPLFQPHLFLIFILYFLLNFDTLVDIRLDYKEEKELKRKQE
jgi:hypothetical protein